MPRSDAPGARAPGALGLLPWLLWLPVAGLATLALLSFRASIGEAHVALLYLLIVLGASARGGRSIGIALAVLCFLAFNFFFVPPYGTLAVHNPLDWLVLFSFLVTGAVAAQLLYRAQSQAEAARHRADEIDRLAALGAETLNAAVAEDAVRAIAQVIRAGLELASCEIYLREAGDRLRLIGRSRRGGDDAPEGTLEGDVLLPAAGESLSLVDVLLRVNARAVLLPLVVQDRRVGVLRMENTRPMALNADQERFAQALAYYAALGVERLRLSAEAGHAEALREADRLKDSLLASVSHDLRTPLTTIRALAQDSAAEGDERAAVIVEEADRLNRLVSDLLDLSRLSAGELRARRELVAAEDLLGAALQQVSGVAATREIRATIPSEPVIVVWADFVHALRVLVNLVDNALKYSPPGAPVEVSLFREGERVSFQVADRGPGIEQEARARVFEPFFRSAGAGPAGGTGLGLAIARRLAEAQQGEVRYQPREGGGSTFTFSLPGARPEELEPMSL